jgi:hypothetical protein
MLPKRWKALREDGSGANGPLNSAAARLAVWIFPWQKLS